MKRLPVVIGAARRSCALQALGWILLLAGFLYVVNVGEELPGHPLGAGRHAGRGHLGLNIVTGYSGQISIGHSFFFGVGAYTTMILVADRLAVRRHPAGRGRHRLPDRLRHRPPGAQDPRPLPLAGHAGSGPGLSRHRQVGQLLRRRLRRPHRRQQRQVHHRRRRHDERLQVDPPSWAPTAGRATTGSDTVVVVAIVLFMLTSTLVRSRVGRGLIAMRDNETGAAVSGVNPAQYKVLAFATSAFVTSVGGCSSRRHHHRARQLRAAALDRVHRRPRHRRRGHDPRARHRRALIEWLPYWSFEGTLPLLPKLEGPEAGVLYGILLVVIIFFMPGGIICGLKVLRSSSS